VTIRWLTIFLDFPGDTCAAGTAFWQRVTGTELSARRGPAGEFATLLPARGDAYLRVQRVLDGPGGCHLDLHVDLATESMEEAATRVAALGARVDRRADDLVLCTSPGGFPFCLVTWQSEAVVPDPVEHDGGGANRLDQLCLDIPADQYQEESTFWQSVTGWELRHTSPPEFSYLVRPDAVAVRLLLQRRAVAGPDDPVTGHIDLACQDTERLAERHVAAGARIEATFPDWLVLTDPTGRPYCLTRRDPG